MLTALAMSLSGCVAMAVDVDQIEKDLGDKGVEGWIHGAVKDHDLFVFTYRNPKDFFDSIQMSLVTDQPDIIAQLQTLSRHDRVRIHGRFLKNPSPQKHIALSALEVVKKYDSGLSAAPYEYEAKIPDDLQKSNVETFLVHAVAGDGAILVLEYKDAVVPVYVKKPSLGRDLFRNDVVRVAYQIQKRPDSPTHLVLDDNVSEPIKVLEHIRDLHGKPAKVEGALVMFPKSPEIMFNVFAVSVDLQAGLKRQYTLLNQDNPEIFKQIRAKLQAAWDKYPNEYVDGRNKLVSKRVRVRATGIFNEIDPGQANAQILLKDASAIEILD